MMSGFRSPCFWLKEILSGMKMDESKQDQKRSKKHCLLFFLKLLLSRVLFVVSAAILVWQKSRRRGRQVIKAIQPFVSPFYDRMPGLISVVDPPFVAKKASSQRGIRCLLFKEICYGLKNGILDIN